METKTIDIQAREWFDRTYGNSYFSAKVTVNFGMPDEKSFIIPFQYGYGDEFLYVSIRELNKRGFIPANIELPYQLRENDIILRYNKVKSSKKDMYK